MTESQALSHMEQMEAHRREFHSHWKKNVEPKVKHSEGSAGWCKAYVGHWQEWLVDHDLHPTLKRKSLS